MDLKAGSYLINEVGRWLFFKDICEISKVAYKIGLEMAFFKDICEISKFCYDQILLTFVEMRFLKVCSFDC